MKTQHRSLISYIVCKIGNVKYKLCIRLPCNLAWTAHNMQILQIYANSYRAQNFMDYALVFILCKTILFNSDRVWWNLLCQMPQFSSLFGSLLNSVQNYFLRFLIKCDFFVVLFIIYSFNGMLFLLILKVTKLFRCSLLSFRIHQMLWMSLKNIKKSWYVVNCERKVKSSPYSDFSNG